MPEQTTDDARDAARYRWLRSRDLNTIVEGGVFAGLTPENVVLNGEDLDRAVDGAMQEVVLMATLGLKDAGPVDMPDRDQTTDSPIDAETLPMEPLPVCRICTQPGYCRAHAQCHYTKTDMIGPDGTRHWREIAKEHPR